MTTLAELRAKLETYWNSQLKFPSVVPMIHIYIIVKYLPSVLKTKLFHKFLPLKRGIMSLIRRDISHVEASFFLIATIIPFPMLANAKLTQQCGSH